MIIMVGYDLEAPNEKLIVEAVALARAFSAEIHVVACMPGSKVARCSWAEKSEIQFSEIEKRLVSIGVPHKTVGLFTGKAPGEKLLEYARETGADYIVIGVYAKSRLQKLVFGSNAQLIILSASCPVVSVNTMPEPI